MARKSDDCSSDVLTDTDSYQTADDDDQPVSPGLDDADVDALGNTPRVSGLKCSDHDADRQQDSSGESESSSSLEEDDRNNEKAAAGHSRLAARQGEPEKRRKSYQFAVSKSGGLIPDTNDDDVVCDLDPEEFHHQHVETSDSCDEDSGSRSEDVPCDLDPREFSHPSVRSTQLTMPVNSNFVADLVTSTVEEGKAMSNEEKHSNSEVSEDDPSEALSALSMGRSEVRVTERHESVVEGNLLPTIVIASPTQKTLDTDRHEWIVHQCAKRVVLDLSDVLQQLPSLTAVGDVEKLSSRVSTSFLYKDSRGDNEQVAAVLSDTSKNEELLPIVEAVICETTELIRAKLIETVALWEEPYMDDDINLSSSPEKESHYPFEESVPAPDYDLSTSSSDTSSEAGADVAVDSDTHSDTPVCRTDRSPTPDYNTLSPVFEQDREIFFEVGGHSKPDLLAEVQKPADSRSEEIKVGDEVDDYGANHQPLLFERKGSQRFSKPIHRSAVILEPKVTELVNKDKTAECEQKDADISDTRELTQSAELTQHSEDLCKAPEQYRSGTESAPVVIPANDKDVSKTHIPSVDQPTLYSTLGHTSYKKKRTAKRSVIIP